VIESRPQERQLADVSEAVFSGLEPDPIERVIAGGQGMVLVTGPPRSGCTTTLLSLLTLLDLEGKSVSTFSSYVTFSTLRVSQLGWYDSPPSREAIRSGLSQKPDAVLFDPGDPSRVLELILEGAAQRLVFVTMEARDAVSAIQRLLEHPQREKLGIDRETVLRSIRAVTHQRLLRRLCAGCRIEDEAPVDKLRRIGIPAPSPLRVNVRGEGCDHCIAGIRGRVGVFETLVVDEPVRLALASGATDRELRDGTRQRGFRTLADHALQRLENGDTSPDEVLRHPWP
jgi:type II secretory ATPase GspE/PulE/Tfp pilus assembly ATPase PilB-like protein